VTLRGILLQDARNLCKAEGFARTRDYTSLLRGDNDSAQAQSFGTILANRRDSGLLTSMLNELAIWSFLETIGVTDCN
jgi:hypothetical protein